MIRPSLLDTQTTELPKTSIVKRSLSEVSPMPAGLLRLLSREQVLDLLAYLEAGAHETHAAFK